MIYLSSVLPGTSTRICLCAEEFGQRSCFLQDCQNKDIPMEMTFSSFIIEEALSVRALQEIVGQNNTTVSYRCQAQLANWLPTPSRAEIVPFLPQEETQAVGGSHRTLLYGHAILLRHQASEMVCITSVNKFHRCNHLVQLLQYVRFRFNFESPLHCSLAVSFHQVPSTCPLVP